MRLYNSTMQREIYRPARQGGIEWATLSLQDGAEVRFLDYCH